jgi:hypothetical protein
MHQLAGNATNPKLTAQQRSAMELQFTDEADRVSAELAAWREIRRQADNRGLLRPH